AFAAASTAIIGLSIGAATAIYALVDSALFRGIPQHGVGQLVAVWQTIPDWRNRQVLAANWDRVVIDYLDFRNWRARQTAFTSVAAWSGGGTTLWSDGRPEQVLLTRASPTLLETIGGTPRLGRFFLPGEDVLGGPNVTVISYETWQSRFGGRRDVIGQTILFDSTRYEIVGVLPENFALQRGQPPRPFFVPAAQNANDQNR